MKLVFILSLLILSFVINGCSTQKESKSKETRTPASEQETAEFLTRCQNGDMYFCYRAGAEEEENGNIKQAKSLYLKACNGQLGIGCDYLGLLYEKEGNSLEAEKSYSKACKNGWMEGCSSLGFINEKRGNFKKSKKLYSKACNGGSMGACQQLCDLVEKEGENKKANRHHLEYCKVRKKEREMEWRGLSRRLKIGPNYDTGLYGSPAIMEESQEKMDPDLIRKILRDNIPLFSNCYQKGLNENNASSGRVKLIFTIGSSGSVIKASTKTSDSNIPKSVIKCINNVLKNIQFPSPRDGGSVEVIQPLNLQFKTK